MKTFCREVKNMPLINVSVTVHQCETGGRLNKKDGLTKYGNSHVKDKTS